MFNLSKDHFRSHFWRIWPSLHRLLPRKKGPAQKQRDEARAAAHRAKQAEETAVAADSSVKNKQDSTESPVVTAGSHSTAPRLTPQAASANLSPSTETAASAALMPFTEPDSVCKNCPTKPAASADGSVNPPANDPFQPPSSPLYRFQYHSSVRLRMKFTMNTVKSKCWRQESLRTVLIQH